MYVQVCTPWCTPCTYVHALIANSLCCMWHGWYIIGLPWVEFFFFLYCKCMLWSSCVCAHVCGFMWVWVCVCVCVCHGVVLSTMMSEHMDCFSSPFMTVVYNINVHKCIVWGPLRHNDTVQGGHANMPIICDPRAYCMGKYTCTRELL